MPNDIRPDVAELSSSDAPPPAIDLLEIRLRPPVVRPGTVPRERLVDRLIRSSDVPIVGIEAPGGYGKSTVLAQWAETDPRPFAWLNVDVRDTDARLMLDYLAEAIARISGAPDGLRATLDTDRPSIWAAAVPRFVAAVASIRTPFVLVLDEVEALPVGEAADVVAAVAEGLPPGSQLVLAGRTLNAFSVPRLVSQGRLTLFRREALRMDDEDAARLLAAAGLHLTAAETHSLNERSEGWPAGLALVASAMEPSHRPEGVAPSLVGEYIHAEWLGRLSEPDRDLLVTTSILDQLNGSLCDAVLDRSDSAGRLVDLETRSQLLTPISGSGGWYRVHQLVRDELAAELERAGPGNRADLHGRAAAWLTANGDREAALEHALAGHNIAIINDLLPGLTQQVFNAGRLDTFRRWYDELEPIGRDIAPEAAYAAAAFFAQAGEAGRSDRWVARAECSAHAQRRDLGSQSQVEATAGLVELSRSLVQDLDPEARLASARAAADAVVPYSRWHLPSLTVLGLAEIANGLESEAAEHFDAGIELWGYGSSPLIAYLTALGMRAAARLERKDVDGAANAIAAARRAIAREHAEALAVSAFIDAVEARLLVRRGAIAAARVLLAHAQPLRGLLTWVMPVPAVAMRLQLAMAYLALSDAAGARTVLDEIREVLRHRPRLGVLVDQVAELERQVAEIHTASISASALTTAELRLLPFLSSHLTFKEIADRLIVSQNTVKTQALSIYRKLDATTRSEAVERAVAFGLLDRSALGFTPAG